MIVQAMPYPASGGGGGGGSISYVGGTTGKQDVGPLPLTSLTGGTGSAPEVGDVVIVAIGVTRTGSLILTMDSSGYTLAASLTSTDNSTLISDLRVWYKVLTSADTQVEFSSDQPSSVAIHVLRGVNAATPLDVAATTAVGTNTGRANPPAITPVTPGSWVYAAGAGGYNSTLMFTSSDLSNFQSFSNNETSFRPQIGAGTHAWESGTFDPAQFGGGTTSVDAAWTAACLAFRPG